MYILFVLLAKIYTCSSHELGKKTLQSLQHRGKVYFKFVIYLIPDFQLYILLY